MANIPFKKEPRIIPFDEESGSSTDDFIKKLQRVRGPQGERGPSAGAAVLDLLSAPQRALKEAISGDENSWGLTEDIPRGSVLGISPGNVEQNFEPEPISTSAQENALDWTVDPLDWVTGGLGKVTSGLRTGAGIVAGSNKGRQTASFSNYVNNYYGLSKEHPEMSIAELEALNEKIAIAAKVVPEKFKPQVDQLYNLEPRQKQMALEKAKGLGSTLVEGVQRGVKDFFSPTDRAMWAQHGVNKATQDIIKDHMVSQGNRWEGKAIAQGQYLNHILRQSGREGNIHPAVQAIADASNLQDYSQNTDGLVEGWLKGYQADEVLPNGNTVPRVMTDTDAEYVANHMNNVTGNPDLMVMKRPEQAQTGKHKFDVLGPKNHGFQKIQGAFARALKAGGGELDNAALGKELSALKGVNVEPAVGGGYWVSNGTNASAITEGGINSLIKVQPDGQVIGFMSDRHDWLEKGMEAVSKTVNKLPGVDMSVENSILENSLAAVSPPMYRNLYDIQKIQDTLYEVGKAPSGYTTSANPRKATKTKGTYSPLKPQYNVGPNKVKSTGNVIAPFDKEAGPQMLQDLLDIKPSAGAVASEYTRMGTGLMGGAAAANRLIDTESEKRPRRTVGGLPIGIGLLRPEE